MRRSPWALRCVEEYRGETSAFQAGPNDLRAGAAFRGDRLIDGPGGRCPFLEDGQQTRCRIYAVRPQKCRRWPYWVNSSTIPERCERPPGSAPESSCRASLFTRDSILPMTRGCSVSP
ncbi:MAG: YkgJ family cysteine cluster protein, partial [Myxococcota bacterium]